MGSSKAIVLGVTGGVASGKSTITQMLADLGAATISADAIAHELTAPGALLTKAILRVFGEGYALPERADALDRTKLAGLVFSNPEERLRLEAITHPPIIAEQERRVAELKEQGYDLIAIEISLLFEAGMESCVDKILVVYCSRATQLARLASRKPSLTPAQLAARIDSQMPLEEKAHRADFQINTDMPLDDVRRDATLLFDKLTASRV